MGFRMPRGSGPSQLRLHAIETLLLWEGRVSRARLLDLFGVHPTLASRDIAAFRAQFPDACEFHQASKSFLATEAMRPALTRGEFAEYQRLIGAAGLASAAAGGVPFEQVCPDRTVIAHRVFAALHRAVREGLTLRITYRSMGSPEPHTRTVRPHSFIQVAPRWHLRAFCREADEFRDFNLGRIAAATVEDGVQLPGMPEDAAWQTFVQLRLVPHRDLAALQAALVRDEFMQGTSALLFEVRQPLARYFVHALGAAVDPDAERPPRHLLMVKSPERLPPGTLWPDPPESRIPSFA